jgi:putative oxidoreductase
MPTSRRDILWRLLAALLGALFIYAGVTKVMDPAEFARDIDNYKLIPWVISVRFAFYLPWLEILCGLALFFRRLYAGALTVLTGLIVVFIAASIAARVRGIDISCGCFGHLSKSWSFPQHLAVDFAILAVLFALCFVSARRSKLQSPRSGGLPTAG